MCGSSPNHPDLETAVDMGDFREDLFYRLNVMPIFLPPLREGIEDIPETARHLLTKIGNDQKRKLSLSNIAQRRLGTSQGSTHTRHDSRQITYWIQTLNIEVKQF